MAVTTDILESWRRPRKVMRRHLAIGKREDRALIFLMVACLLIFVGQWPALQRAAELDSRVPLDARLGGALMAWLFIMPLVLYATAAITHLVARAVGGRGSWYSARLALFWSLLATSPLLLLRGLVAGMIGPSPALLVTDTVALVGFFMIWMLSLIEAERGSAAE